jgi:hypothetical protein
MRSDVPGRKDADDYDGQYDGALDGDDYTDQMHEGEAQADDASGYSEGTSDPSEHSA